MKRFIQLVVIGFGLFAGLASADLLQSTGQLGPVVGGSGGTTFVGGTITSPILGANGTAAAPTYGFSGDAGEGIYLAAANATGFAAAGVEAFRINSAGILVASGLNIKTQGFSGLGVNNGGGYFGYNTSTTPDTMWIATDPTSNALLIAENADFSFDFAHAAATDPTLFIHSHNQNTTQWISLNHDGTDGIVNVGTGGVKLVGADSEAGNVQIAQGATTRLNIGNDGVEHYAIRGSDNFTYGWVAGGGAPTADLASGFKFATANTPDTVIYGAPAASNNLLIAEWADRNFDFAHAQATDPTLFIHSHNQNTTQWLSANHDGTDGLLSVGVGSLALNAPASGAKGILLQSGGTALVGVGSDGTGNTVALSASTTLQWGTNVFSAPDTSITRSAAGIVRVGAGAVASTIGAIQSAASVVANTGAATPSILLSGTVYTNTGDGDGSTVTLPNDPIIGTTFTVTAVAAQNITLAPNTGETIMFGNTVCNTSFVIGGAATGIGDSATVIAATGGSGAVWITTASAGTPVCTP